MSEYQYYEWQTLDRPLTPQEQAAVNKLSSHIDVTSTRAIVTYSWGDFKHDPLQVLARYFDAFLYLTNWGSKRLAFRFPTGLLVPDQIEPYLWDYRIDLKPVGDYLVLDISLDEEEGGDWIEGEGWLSSKKATSYDKAVTLLRKLRDLAEYQGRKTDFQARLADLQARYANRPALRDRLQQARLL
ncbi:MAG TPA: hypothetical protein PKZ84_24150 [Anaerolineae bacterium]|nr:hypothetical protein [Anaerolineae bacterium]HQI87698.1 hypothetical protein [Anaerolineae bacterium]